MSDDGMNARLQRGCKIAFRDLFDREASRLFASIRECGHSCLTDQDIDDIVAEAFMSLFRAVDRGVADDFNPVWYLHGIAKKRVISRIRNADGPKATLNRTPAIDFQEPSCTRTPPPFQRLLNEELQAVLDAAMAMLSQRELLAIQWCQNHKPPEWDTFERETGLPAQTGRKLATNARKKLRNALDQYRHAAELKGGKASDNRARKTG